MVQQLAKLKALDPHEVWSHEAHDFTPWLLDNADALAEVLGIDIELTENEHPVGKIALDLIGRDLTNECVLIVEHFGATAVTSGITVNSTGTQLTVTAPAEPAGTVDMTVTVGAFTSVASSSETFTYY